MLAGEGLAHALQAVQVGGGVLDAHDIFVGQQPSGVVLAELHPGKLGDVVDDGGQVGDGGNDIFIVPHDLVHGELVVVGGDHGDGHRPGGHGVPGQIHHISGADGAHVGNDGDLALGGVDHVLHDFLALLQGEQQTLAGGAAAVKALGPVLDLQADDFLQGVIVDALILPGGGDQRGKDTLKVGRIDTYHAVQPPSTTRLEPVMKELA